MGEMRFARGLMFLIVIAALLAMTVNPSANFPAMEQLAPILFFFTAVVELRLQSDAGNFRDSETFFSPVAWRAPPAR